MHTKDHWNHVYATKPATGVSWYQEHAEQSLRLIRQTGLGPGAAIIDVGAGASTLVDDLLDEGHTALTVLDLSASALATAQARLGPRAQAVRWLEGNILDVDLAPQSFDIWHDRAVFHFLTTEAERQAYVRQVLRAVKPEGHVIVATFAEDGPTQCSGLPVMRYSPTELPASSATPSSCSATSARSTRRRSAPGRSSSTATAGSPAPGADRRAHPHAPRAPTPHPRRPAPMFSHIMIGSNDIERSKRFYDAVLGVLGVGEAVRNQNATGQTRLFYRHDGATFCLTEPINGQPASCANGGTIGFRCQSPEQVRQFHDTAVAHGGVSIEDPPGLREGKPGALYLAYVRDPDGHKLCAVHRPG